MAIPLIIPAIAVISAVAPISWGVGTALKRNLTSQDYHELQHNNTLQRTQAINKGLDTAQMALIIGGGYLIYQATKRK